MQLMGQAPSIPRSSLAVYALQAAASAADLSSLSAAQAAMSLPTQLLTPLLSCRPASCQQSPAQPAAEPAEDPCAEIISRLQLNEEQMQALRGVQRWFQGQVIHGWLVCSSC